MLKRILKKKKKKVTWKIVELAEASVLYIYIYIDYITITTSVTFSPKSYKNKIICNDQYKNLTI